MSPSPEVLLANLPCLYDKVEWHKKKAAEFAAAYVGANKEADRRSSQLHLELASCVEECISTLITDFRNVKSFDDDEEE